MHLNSLIDFFITSYSYNSWITDNFIITANFFWESSWACLISLFLSEFWDLPAFVFFFSVKSEDQAPGLNNTLEDEVLAVTS